MYIELIDRRIDEQLIITHYSNLNELNRTKVNALFGQESDLRDTYYTK